MEYMRYALGSHLHIKWVECTDCGTADDPAYVWQGNDSAVNFNLVVGAVMQHELMAHPRQTRKK